MSDLQANRPYLVCPKHGRFTLTREHIYHTRSDAVRGYPGSNPRFDPNSRTFRRRTPFATCPADGCYRVFTNNIMSPIYDVRIDLADDTSSSDDQDSEEEQTYHDVDYYSRFVPGTATF